MELITTTTKTWITCLLLGIATCPGVRADQTRTAVIASSCVVGVLLCLAIGISIFFCYRTVQRRTEKRPLPKHKKGRPEANGVPKVFRHDQPGSPRAKAYTQHAVHPRQRPPVMFYTLKADPREAMMSPDHPGFTSIAPPHPYRGAPPVGRPVFFLNYMDGERHPGYPGSYMYPNGGGMMYYGNDGPLIEEIPPSLPEAKRHHRHESKESRHSKRDKSRSKSRTRSSPKLNGGVITPGHYPEVDKIPVFAHPDNFILTSKDDDISGFARNASQKPNILTQEINNNVGIEMTPLPTQEDSALNDIEQTQNNGEDMDVRDGPFSVTQISSTSNYRVPENFSNRAFQEREQTMSFEDEDEDKELSTENQNSTVLDLDSGENVPENTPRVDYDASQTNFDFPEQTPRIDYLDETSQNTTKKDDTGFRVQDLDDIIALGTSSQDVRDPDEIDLGESNGSHPRPPTPPFDADPRISQSSDTLAGTNSSVRVDESDPLERLDNLARIPTPPPPPPAEFKSACMRPGTPPPGLIKKENVDIDDILRLGNESSGLPTKEKDEPQKSPFGTPGNTGSSLPFMEELRRRQRSIDDDGSLSPPLAISASDSPSPQYVETSPDHQGDFLGVSTRMNHRSSLVQFAQDPPQIIPDMDYPDSPDSDHQPPFQQSSGSPGAPSPPPPPPPPPPPLPPPPPQ